MIFKSVTYIHHHVAFVPSGTAKNCFWKGAIKLINCESQVLGVRGHIRPLWNGISCTVEAHEEKCKGLNNSQFNSVKKYWFQNTWQFDSVGGIVTWWFRLEQCSNSVDSMSKCGQDTQQCMLIRVHDEGLGVGQTNNSIPWKCFPWKFWNLKSPSS